VQDLLNILFNMFHLFLELSIWELTRMPHIILVRLIVLFQHGLLLLDNVLTAKVVAIIQFVSVIFGMEISSLLIQLPKP